MKYRELGATGIFISEIGFGAWGIGGVTPDATSYGLTDDRESLQALKCAYEHGISFYDTSNIYGAGHSEELIGRVFTNYRSDIVIATKAGLNNYRDQPDFSVKNLLSSLDASLRRLRTDYVDLFQLHNPPIAIIKELSNISLVMDELKDQGKIRAFGVSLTGPEDGLSVLKYLKPDAIQVNFNLLDQRVVESGLLQMAKKHNVSVIARTPLCFGFLNTRNNQTEFQPEDHRSRWPLEQIQSWILLADKFTDCKENSYQQSAVQFALRFCLTYPEISSVIPGMMKKNEVIENILASELGPLDANTLSNVVNTYKKETNIMNSEAKKYAKIH